MIPTKHVNLDWPSRPRNQLGADGTRRMLRAALDDSRRKVRSLEFALERSGEQHLLRARVLSELGKHRRRAAGLSAALKRLDGEES